MKEAAAMLLSVLTVIIGCEVIREFCPDSMMMKLTNALVATALLLAMAAGAARIDFDFQLPETDALLQDSALGEYIAESEKASAEQEVCDSVEAMLASVGIRAKKIEANIDITEEGSIELKELKIFTEYEEDSVRAQALLENLLNGGAELEVYTDGG